MAAASSAVTASSSLIRSSRPAAARRRQGMEPPAAASTRPTLVRCGAAVKFAKYQGLGNDFILVSVGTGGQPQHQRRQRRPTCIRRACQSHPIHSTHCPAPQVDNRHQQEPVLTPEQAAALCDRNFGIGGDGVIFALPAQGAQTDYAMRIYNSGGGWLGTGRPGEGGRCGAPRALAPLWAQIFNFHSAHPGAAAAAAGVAPLASSSCRHCSAVLTAGACCCAAVLTAVAADGSEPEMCGNGIRCLARFVADRDGVQVCGAALLAVLHHLLHSRPVGRHVHQSAASNVWRDASLLWHWALAFGCRTGLRHWAAAEGCCREGWLSEVRWCQQAEAPCLDWAASIPPELVLWCCLQAQEYRVDTLAGLIQPALLADGQVRLTECPLVPCGMPPVYLCCAVLCSRALPCWGHAAHCQLD